MISPQINDTAADICERLIEINAQISGKNAEKTDAANIEAQFETKITLIKFIRKNVEKWSDSGKWHKRHQHNRKRNDNVYPAKLYKGNFTEGIWCTVSFVGKIHITLL